MSKTGHFLLFCFTRASGSRIIELTGELKHFCTVLFEWHATTERTWMRSSFDRRTDYLEVKWQK
jgi:hypothetical protein